MGVTGSLRADQVAIVAPLTNPASIQIVVGGAAVDPRDVSDRVGRLLGQITFGGLAIDPRTIRALTVADAINVGQWIGSAAPTIGQKAMAASIPIVIASDQTVVKAREDTAAMAWVSAKTAAPGIGAVQADTGALAAGDYDFDIELVVSDTTAVGRGLVVEHRNAANGATLQNLGGCSVPGNQEVHLRRYTLALNERIRVIAGTAAGTAASMYVSAIGRRIT